MLAFVLREPHAEAVAGLLDEWEAEEARLHAPVLARYEIASVLARSRVRDDLSRGDAEEAVAIIEELDVTFHPSSEILRTVEIAVELRRHSAYDAAYLALTEDLDAELWTLDGPLARNADTRHRVRLID